jgi:hypothetical protein
VIVHRVGADKFLGAFRQAMRTRDWDDGDMDTSTTSLYPSPWRGVLRAELDVATALLQPNKTKGNNNNNNNNNNDPTNSEVVRLRAALAVAEKELQQLRAQFSTLQESANNKALLATPPPPDTTTSLDTLVSRDRTINELKARVLHLETQLTIVTNENDRLLVMLADQEMALAGLNQ